MAANMLLLNDAANMKSFKRPLFLDDDDDGTGTNNNNYYYGGHYVTNDDDDDDDKHAAHRVDSAAPLESLLAAKRSRPTNCASAGSGSPAACTTN